MSPLRPWLPIAVCAAIVLALPAGSPRAQEIAEGDLFGCPGSAWPWTGQGFFVNIPAGLAASPAGLVSTGLALALVPADLIESGLSQKNQDEPIPRFAHVGVCAGIYLGKGLAIVAGAPFWVLKQAFWNGPKRLFTRQAPPATAEP
ncbi:MAG: hypothetical protein A2X36_02660 [Elusimicrobia bacterium GWA2_69_24]|nr:MAG: hypothetical protein A2X36_02660 [Elusimicrobia bacterium GWA2_69_24]HBL15564.1 hypothetical protein [Elusimicrobiota bacterium]